ncbi:hypothetical protein BOW53_00510 [Solemya pervernicosa gill symbiont]|uniref:Thioredoxin domain-containing protein n=3 Tax=Gammaproteobacteria incertae sedis TaxID=118884 RepID=A0A1T2LBC4_9GAMM|nr:hypothetical protein BOW53_00510 [Solemya pervernicosa gill symbiont]QKQ28165.1 SCO family protein [Candidatus Reidiella endopervernicosa]
MKQRLPYILLLLLTSALIWLLLFWSPNSPDLTHLLKHNQSRGGDFTLSGNGGEPFDLKQLRGKVGLLYFGYTTCPDVCPTSLALMKIALGNMSEKELEQVSGVFISVDPERDKPQRLMEYANYFHTNIVGTSGSRAEIDEAARRYGVMYRKVESDSAVGYLVDHTSATYVIDKQGKLHTTLAHGTPHAEILKTVRALLEQSK